MTQKGQCVLLKPHGLNKTFKLCTAVKTLSNYVTKK